MLPHLLLIATGLAASLQAAPQGTSHHVRPKLKVFLLAGQSNMEGQAVVDLDHDEHYNGGRGTLARLAGEPGTAELLGHLRKDDGAWTERDDVWVWYQTAKGELKAGPLSIGYGVYPGRHHFGPELQLGHVLGDWFDEQVLLVKTAWGGKSLARDFRPPSAGGEVGAFYTQMVAEYRDALARLEERFPAAAELEPELAGFVWFQGWNDMIDDAATAEYEDNLVHLIGDLRRELAAPDLPVVIAETGNCGNEVLRGAQAAVAGRRELSGNAAFVPTASFLRAAEDSPNQGHGHHWFGNAESYVLIGEAMGRAMTGLLRERTSVQDEQLPNVVLLYTDDQGYGDCSALNPEAKFRTPNMDRIAREGMTFTDGHSAGSVCTPSRYALLTGRYAWRTRLKRGVFGADADCLIEDGRVTLATVLAGRGYATAIFGKWHLGLQIPGQKGDRDWSQPVTDGPLQKGFQTFYGIPASMNFGVLTWFDGAYATEPATLWTRKKFPVAEIETAPLDYRMAPPFDEKRVKKGDVEVAPGFVDSAALSIVTEHAVAYIAEKARSQRPFFLYVPFTSPHLPHCTAPEFRGKSGMGNYGDFMLETDHRIGEILDALDRGGLADDTLVVLTSDNGPENNYRDWIRLYDHHASGGFRGGKRDLYEGGHRVPFLVRWPRVIEAGTTSDEPVCQTDLLATLAEIVGVELGNDAAEDSISLLPALRSTSDGSPFRGPIVHQSGSGHFGLRDGRWKLVARKPAQGGGFELYDLAVDPREETDVSDSKPEVVARLRDVLTELVQRGRSRPGAARGNDGDAWWPQLTWIAEPGR